MNANEQQMACPHCSGAMTVTQDLAGQKVYCPHCGQAAIVPSIVSVKSHQIPSAELAPQFDVSMQSSSGVAVRIHKNGEGELTTVAKWTALGRSIGCFGIICIIVLIGLVVIAVEKDDRKESDADSKSVAWKMAQKFVKERLKAPSTASFGSVLGDYQDPNDVVEDLGNGKFRVSAWVDSENTFSAMIRSHFICELEWIGGNNWRCAVCVFVD